MKRMQLERIIDQVSRHLLAAALIIGLIVVLYLATAEPAPETTIVLSEVDQSEIFRNYGFVVVGLIGVVLAVVRSFQTNQQIESTKRQLDQTQAQFDTTQQSLAHRQDQDTFQEACKLLADEDKAISLAGFSILENLERGSHFERQASDVLNTFGLTRAIMNGYDRRIQRTIARTLTGRQEALFQELYLINIVLEEPEGDVSCRNIEVFASNIKGLGYIRGSTWQRKPRWRFVACNIEGPLELNGSSVFFKDCILGPGVYRPGGSVSASNCVIYEERQQARLTHIPAPALPGAQPTNRRVTLARGMPGGQSSVRAWGYPEVAAHTHEAALERDVGWVGAPATTLKRLTPSERLGVGLSDDTIG